MFKEKSGTDAQVRLKQRERQPFMAGLYFGLWELIVGCLIQGGAMVVTFNVLSPVVFIPGCVIYVLLVFVLV